jgi:nucleoside-diphosphate-sugar epimerase
LAPDHELRLTDLVDSSGSEARESLRADLRDAEAVAPLIAGVDAVIHTCETPDSFEEPDLTREELLLDLATRGTHVLMTAAVEAGVRRVACAGTLEVFASYPDDVYISELWKPLPRPEMSTFSKYLGELTVREFARDHAITGTSLRLGRVVREEDVAGEPVDLMWVDVRDAAQAFRGALGRDASSDVRFAARWDVLHICADVPNAKFLIAEATRRIGYAPTHGFAANYQA